MRVLFVAEDENIYLQIKELLTQVDIEWAATFDDAVRTLKLGRHDVALVDCQLSNRKGLELLQEIRALDFSGATIALGGQNSVGVDALKAGADD